MVIASLSFWDSRDDLVLCGFISTYLSLFAVVELMTSGSFRLYQADFSISAHKLVIPASADITVKLLTAFGSFVPSLMLGCSGLIHHHSVPPCHCSGPFHSDSVTVTCV